jgi:hypothetical protein
MQLQSDRQWFEPGLPDGTYKIPIWVNFGRHWIGQLRYIRYIYIYIYMVYMALWCIFWLFGLFCGYFVYFVAIWYNVWSGLRYLVDRQLVDRHLVDRHLVEF